MGPVKYIIPVIHGAGGGTPRRTHLTKSGFGTHLFHWQVKNISWKYLGAVALLWKGSSEADHLQSAVNYLSTCLSGRNSKEPRIWPENLSLPPRRTALLHFPAVLAGFQGHLLGWISTCVCGIHAFPPSCTSAPLLMPSNTIITQRSTSSARCCMQVQGGKIPACQTFQAGERQWTETACPHFMNKRSAVPLWIWTGW